MLSRVLFEKYIYILTLKMASPSGNQHYASCIGTLSFPVLHMEPEAICVRVVRPSVRTSVPGRKHSLTGLPSTSSFSCLIGRPLQPVTKLLWRTFVSRNHILFFFHGRQSKLRLRSGAPLMDQFKYTQRCQICAALC